MEKCAQDTAETPQPCICRRGEAVIILGRGKRARIELTRGLADQSAEELDVDSGYWVAVPDTGHGS